MTENGGEAGKLALAISAIDAHRTAASLPLRSSETVSVLPMWAIRSDIAKPFLHPVRLSWGDGRVTRDSFAEVAWFAQVRRHTSSGVCSAADALGSAEIQRGMACYGGVRRTSPQELNRQHDQAMLRLVGMVEASLTRWVRHFDSARLEGLVADGFDVGQPLSETDIQVAVNDWMFGEQRAKDGHVKQRWAALVDRLVELKFLGKYDSPYLWLNSELRRFALRIVSNTYGESPMADQIRRVWRMWSSSVVQPDGDAGKTLDPLADFVVALNDVFPNADLGAKRVRSSLAATTVPSSRSLWRHDG